MVEKEAVHKYCPHKKRFLVHYGKCNRNMANPQIWQLMIKLQFGVLYQFFNHAQFVPTIFNDIFCWPYYFVFSFNKLGTKGKAEKELHETIVFVKQFPLTLQYFKVSLVN